MQQPAKLNPTGLFLQELLFRPREVGALLPSSRNLAAAMARWLPSDGEGYALELGPGTGVVTQALFDRGLPQDRLVAIEQSPKMADHLRARFPRAKIITGDAFQLDKLLRRQARHVDNVRVVFSSLPLRNFPPAVADQLARRIRSTLSSGGKLVQYSYHVWNLRTEATDHFKFVASNVIWLNLPPARVSVYQK